MDIKTLPTVAKELVNWETENPKNSLDDVHSNNRQLDGAHNYLRRRGILVNKSDLRDALLVTADELHAPLKQALQTFRSKMSGAQTASAVSQALTPPGKTSGPSGPIFKNIGVATAKSAVHSALPKTKSNDTPTRPREDALRMPSNQPAFDVDDIHRDAQPNTDELLPGGQHTFDVDDVQAQVSPKTTGVVGSAPDIRNMGASAPATKAFVPGGSDPGIAAHTDAPSAKKSDVDIYNVDANLESVQQVPTDSPGVEAKQQARELQQKVIDFPGGYDLQAHMKDTAGIAKMIAKAIQKSPELGIKITQADLKAIDQAATTYDAGMALVPKQTLTKTGKYSQADVAAMQAHVKVDKAVMRAMGAGPRAIDIARFHHRDYAGGGYPKPGPRGENIPVLARIFRIADSYVAMTSERSFRKAMIPEAARNELLNGKWSKGAYDPKLVKFFVEKVIGAPV